MKFGKKKADCCKHYPIADAPKDTIIILWFDSYDCGWTCDLGWITEKGEIYESTAGGNSNISDRPYSHFQLLSYPKETPA